MKRNCIVRSCVFACSCFVAVAQTGVQSGLAKMTKYQEASRIKVDGVVENVEQRSLGGTCKAPGVFVTVNASGQTLELQVGPKWFIDDLTWSFTKGDKLEIVGWKAAEASNEIVVRKISRGEWILEPRDDTGTANWLWMTPPKDSGKCT